MLRPARFAWCMHSCDSASCPLWQTPSSISNREACPSRPRRLSRSCSFSMQVTRSGLFTGKFPLCFARGESQHGSRSLRPSSDCHHCIGSIRAALRCMGYASSPSSGTVGRPLRPRARGRASSRAAQSPTYPDSEIPPLIVTVTRASPSESARSAAGQPQVRSGRVGSGRVRPGQVRSGQVRYRTRPKSEAMRVTVTRQLGLPPRYRRFESSYPRIDRCDTAQPSKYELCHDTRAGQ